MKNKRFPKNKSYKRPRKSFVIALIVALLVLAGLGSAYLLDGDTSSSNPIEPVKNKDDINLEPPSEKDLEATNKHKENLGNTSKNNSESKPNNTTNAAKPIITSSGTYNNSVEVGARVPGIFEEKGTCILKLRKSGKTISKSQSATQNVSEMSCGFISISKSKLSHGTWSAQVSYKSDRYDGTSDVVKIKVQ